MQAYYLDRFQYCIDDDELEPSRISGMWLESGTCAMHPGDDRHVCIVPMLPGEFEYDWTE